MINEQLVTLFHYTIDSLDQFNSRVLTETVLGMTKVAKFLSREERGAPAPNLEICFTARTWNTTDSYLIHTLMHRLTFFKILTKDTLPTLLMNMHHLKMEALRWVALHWNR